MWRPWNDSLACGGLPLPPTGPEEREFRPGRRLFLFPVFFPACRKIPGCWRRNKPLTNPLRPGPGGIAGPGLPPPQLGQIKEIPPWGFPVIRIRASDIKPPGPQAPPLARPPSLKKPWVHCTIPFFPWSPTCGPITVWWVAGCFLFFFVHGPGPVNAGHNFPKRRGVLFGRPPCFPALTCKMTAGVVWRPYYLAALGPELAKGKTP